jgi:hypothetical protein
MLNFHAKSTRILIGKVAGTKGTQWSGQFSTERRIFSIWFAV